MSEHPDTEALSAHFDGEAPELTTHVEACASCRAELARFATLKAALLGPVSPMALVSVDEAIKRALPPAGEQPLGEQPLGAPAPSAPVLAARPRWDTRKWTVAASIAAALVLCVGIAGVLAAGNGGGRDRTEVNSAAPTPSTPDSQRSFSGDTETSAAAGIPIDGGDLGPVTDGPSLLARIGPRVSQLLPGNTSPAAAVPPGDGSDGSEPMAREVGTRACEPQARESKAGLGEVVYVARASYQGQPWFILGFAAPGNQKPITLLVMTQDGCRLLLESTTP